jgi:signal transduction histidine kinase
MVALGAIFILAAVVLFAIQSYFANVQFDELYQQAETATISVAQTCYSQGSCNNLVSTGGRYSFNFLFIMGTDGQLPLPPNANADNDDSITLITQALQQSLKGQQVKGHIPLSVRGNPPTPFVYVSVPVYKNGSSGGPVIGALLLAQPEQYPKGTPPPFLTNVNIAVIISSAAIALLVVVFSLFMARRLTRPVEALTVAAEQMKRGKYTERVAVPKTQDELGQLALTFNEMANTIESDVNELRQQDKMRRELIANIAHDLATPLTAVQGFSEALADDLISKPEERHETAQLIGREVQRLRRLVADMQQMSSLESGQIKLDLAPLDLSSLVDETLAVLTQESEEAGITITNEIAPSTPLVLADSDRVTQVLFNLLDNARRHTPRGGSITVSAQQEGPMLRVSIADTGVGIDANDLPHIFERFYRADRSRTGATGGSGLGLSIVKAIITAHRGDICAESTPGKGTRISFTLPLAEGERT